ncbi:phage portal protein [Bremerella cremea]|uniref:phage portal protein n=1 Tax=Bremerella cremea TaxID=1031537 RepID=UPI0031F0AFBE
MIKRLGSWAAGKLLSSFGGSWFGQTMLQFMGLPTAAGPRVDERNAMNHSAAFACTRILSSSGAVLPWNLKRPKEGGGSLNATEHPLYRILHRRPNPRMTSMYFRLYGLAQQINWGNFYAEVDRNQFGEVVALYPIHASRVTYQEQADGSVVYTVQNNGGSVVEFTNGPDLATRCELLHIPSIYPAEDGIGGMGTISKARETIGMGMAVREHGAKTFANGCRPTVAVKLNKTKLENDTRARFRKEWAEATTGPQRGKPILLDGTMELQQFSWNNEDSQFLGTLEYNDEDVARWYGVPPHMIQILKRATFNNIEMQSTEFVVYSLVPWIEMWDQVVETSLLTPAEVASGYFVKHNVNGLLRGDSKARGEFYRLLWGLGAITINEIRELEDYNPIGPDGDKHFVPLNVTTAARAGTAEAEKQQATMPASSSGDQNQNDRQQAARQILADVLRRMWTKEGNAAKRAAKNPETFSEWLSTFYDSHQAVLLEAVGPFNRLAVLLDLAIAYPSDLVAQSRQRLEAIDPAAAGDQFAAMIAAEVDSWPEDRLSQTLRSMEGRTHVATN